MHPLSASRLNDFLGCPHQVALWLAGIRPREEVDATLQLIRDKEPNYPEAIKKLSLVSPFYGSYTLVCRLTADACMKAEKEGLWNEAEAALRAFLNGSGAATPGPEGSREGFWK